ncbi:MAG: hypothetical protein WCT08_03075 [Patescibacteria group bacterium]|jgi:hypothetical protein
MRLNISHRKKAKKSANQENKGITLLVSLLVMSVVVAIGITISTVVVSQVKINLVVTQGHQNYYIAESGIENALETLKEKKGGTIAEALTAIQSLVFPSGSDITADLTKSDSLSGGQTVPTELKENSSAFIDLYDVDASLSSIGIDPPVFCVYGESTDEEAPYKDNEVMEVTWIAWSENLEVSAPQKALVAHSNFSDPSGCAPYGGQAIDLTYFFSAFTYTGSLAGFRFKVTALKPPGPPTPGDGDIKNFKVYTSPTDLSTQIQVKSVSNYAGQTQALVATFPWSTPLSSFYDFVIFSEEDLKKELSVSVDQTIKKFGPYPAVSSPISDVAFVGCDSSPCQYYIRLLRADAKTWGEFDITTSGAASGTEPQTIIVTSNITSCIVRNYYTFSTASGNTITFSAIPADGPTQYELISKATFIDPSETYCPT